MTKHFNANIKQLKTSNPREYWKLFKKQKNVSCTANENDLFRHFSEMNRAPDFANDIPPDGISDIDFQSLNFDALNEPITAIEISKSIKSLGNNKASGLDVITNEMLKASEPYITSILVVLFNCILNSGIFPENWTPGLIIPLYKGKGDPKNPVSYRGITLSSCVGKLFTGLMNMRLTKFLDCNQILHDNQAGFRKNHGVCDHIFTLKSIIDLFLINNRKLYCAFIDYERAFDTVWRKAL